MTARAFPRRGKSKEKRRAKGRTSCFIGLTSRQTPDLRMPTLNLRMRGFETSDERKAGRLMSLAIYSTPIHTRFPMKRLFPIIFLLILASVCPAKDKPNILWLITDNCNLDFGCFGRQGFTRPTSTNWPPRASATTGFSRPPRFAPRAARLS